MFSTEFLLKLLDRDKTSQYIYTLLFISLITVFDFFTLFIFSKMLSIYLYLGIITTISFLGVLLVIKMTKNTISTIEGKHDKRIYPEIEFYDLTTLFFAAIFIIFPGIVSSIIGYILLLPFFRHFIGRKLTKKLKLDWYAVYEYKEIYNK